MGWYDVNSDIDNVTDDGDVNGWVDVSQLDFGQNAPGGCSYRFGPVINHIGTWGQLIFRTPTLLDSADMSNPAGLNGHMPSYPAPGNSFWVQGHLVNGECGGRGSKAAYVTPISHNLNMLHAGYEGVLQRLVNRGDAAGLTQVMFNPNQIINSCLIYRTHAIAPDSTIAGPDAPAGLVVSLGIVINGIMQSADDIEDEFANGTGAARWFGPWYYTSDSKFHRAKILEMIGGAALGYF